MSSSVYDGNFYKLHENGSLKSANEIVPLVLNIISCTSVADIGCGDANWLSVFKQSGITNVLGVDGAYVDRKMLKIPENQFLCHDLSQPLQLNRRFDLVVSVEVAEHISADHADIFLDTVTSLAPVVLFSAAIPYQGGTYHVNEQWPSYWTEKFCKRGYSLVDCIRPKIWTNPNVDWWYAQNTFLFATAEVLASNAKLNQEAQRFCSNGLALIHPTKYLEVCEALEYISKPENTPVRQAAQRLWLTAKRSIKRRLGRV